MDKRATYLLRQDPRLNYCRFLTKNLNKIKVLDLSLIKSVRLGRAAILKTSSIECKSITENYMTLGINYIMMECFLKTMQGIR